MVCIVMKSISVDEEQDKLKAFLFSLKQAEKVWFFSILLGFIDTRNGMKKILSCQHKKKNMWDLTISRGDTH